MNRLGCVVGADVAIGKADHSWMLSSEASAHPYVTDTAGGRSLLAERESPFMRRATQSFEQF